MGRKNMDKQDSQDDHRFDLLFGEHTVKITGCPSDVTEKFGPGFLNHFVRMYWHQAILRNLVYPCPFILGEVLCMRAQKQYSVDFWFSGAYWQLPWTGPLCAKPNR